MYSSAVVRIIDENFNRLAEGLRVLEETARMILNDNDSTSRLKSLRHDLIRSDLPFHLQLLQSRDSENDVGADLEVQGETKEKELSLIVVANSRRVQESLRVLEELAKLPEFADRLDSNRFKNARFEIYTLEKDLVGRLARQDKVKKIKGLYVVIDLDFLGQRNSISVIKEVIQARVKVVQLRAKTTPKKQLLGIARELQQICKQQEVLFILNDYLDIALAIEADGLHIGQEDLPAEEARKLLPLNTVLGVSAATPEEVLMAEKAGVDYIGVGAIFPTSSKDNIDVVGIERLRQIKALTQIPLVAIGGLNKNNVKEAISAGADSICVISAILGAKDISLAVREIIQIIEDKNEKIN
jgi:thiamine-phosphate pyrophosphorylase